LRCCCPRMSSPLCAASSSVFSTTLRPRRWAYHRTSHHTSGSMPTPWPSSTALHTPLGRALVVRPMCTSPGWAAEAATQTDGADGRGPSSSRNPVPSVPALPPSVLQMHQGKVPMHFGVWHWAALGSPEGARRTTSWTSHPAWEEGCIWLRLLLQRPAPYAGWPLLRWGTTPRLFSSLPLPRLPPPPPPAHRLHCRFR